MYQQSESSPRFEWGVAGRTFPGESESGDIHFVQRIGSRVLLGVIDGLGHGKEAAVAARISVNVIESFAHESIESLFTRCHEQLQTTRGAAITLLVLDLDTGTLQWLGVGNVKAVLCRARLSTKPSNSDLIIRGGIVGSRHLPLLHASEDTLYRGDLLVLATDGIHYGFLHDLKDISGIHPQDLADRLLMNHQQHADDSLVLVVRYMGETSS